MLRSTIFAALFLSTSAALSCGVCVEDKMAAVYDHAVVARALNQKHYVAFFHVDGNLVAGEATKRAVEKAAYDSPSSDKGSVRVSVESASLSVAFNPRRTTMTALQKDLERRLAARKLSLMLLQVLEKPSDVNPSVARALRTHGK